MMGIERRSSLFFILFFLSSLLIQSQKIIAEKKPYVVYFGEHSHNKDEISTLTKEKATNTHYEVLGTVLKSKEKAKDAIFYSYTNYINGFAANLEEEEAMEISKYPGVVSVFPSRGYKLHTTRSWEFMGLEKNGKVPSQSLWNRARYGEDTIIGNLDTGVWPESESFRDDGMGLIPTRWKGICQDDIEKPFPCNRKLIGARYFNKAYQAAIGPLNSTFDSPRDTDGHGTHTLSTAGGSPVKDASIYGFGKGTARGGSPKARVAAYKVCWPPVNGSECYDADIIAGFDAAIHDGVDVLSVSLGGDASGFLDDGIALGSFHAVKNGITVVCSAGNSGPVVGSVSNLAPWILTVGASTMDREFPSYLSYNGIHVKGQSLSPTHLLGKRFYPMISSTEAQASNASLLDAQLCISGALDPGKVKGKVVVCLRGKNGRMEKGLIVLKAGGAGMVLANDVSTGDEVIADAHLLPATQISYSEGLQLFSYLNSTKSAFGYITIPKTVLNTKPAPVMAAFSSRGPNTINPEILKPDITAPGVTVIASWSPAVGPSGESFDTRIVSFNSESGTSMSCPHISGVVGLLKTMHPEWSPAAIKSAIMTSAKVRDNTGKTLTNSSLERATPLDYGSGHVRPNRAMNPGLIYDLTTTDYLNFLCALNYNASQIAMFKPYQCPSKPVKIEDLNYPTISIPSLSGEALVTRTVRNVGSPGTYTARVISPKGVTIRVKPTKLEFSKIGEEKEFVVSLKAKRGGPEGYEFGTLIWSDGKHYVRSPIVVKGKSH